ncbi:hypothetical protein NOF04DRAFT_13968 [Fusarium oxysporum II5]|uniref:Uncharacterized protein n=2 Tax=Fusarium oxysporum species complex TaxID=171631 RepID=A0A5C6SL17_FUSOC|nr:uncharacterized protein FOIG_16941 [Fusarium odoratissimum NRRL 54006]KAK2122135.1 hypothetical protein NOF04DRAFT_13968 [Fusarium oxysporum II5]TXB98090.1 hypothetical protein FocTR4_00017221 [Fusarium oxysporum f. sp. cubense]EXL89775.1 hypothetical protein FOIG_16941 [Fusarium odoratissimum NRRL 54006]TXC12406.1 hypothetical protein FocTR4_00017267 [Fusarium oxysporum f. sp. cubense]TXC12424.1 hypothetical protein FocTR4_00017239 [Fusarium oxysporum f. sp. cubense]
MAWTPAAFVAKAIICTSRLSIRDLFPPLVTAVIAVIMTALAARRTITSRLRSRPLCQALCAGLVFGLELAKLLPQSPVLANELGQRGTNLPVEQAAGDV